MADPFRPPVAETPATRGDNHTWDDPRTARRRQYDRVREYCGVTLDQLVNSSSAKRYLRELWLLGCMVRQPRKAAELPAVNPFRSSPRPLEKRLI